MDNVPRAYCRHIKHLEISTLLDPFDFSSSVGFRTETVISILLASPCLSSLTLCIGGSLSGNVLAPFPHFLDLKELVVKNLNDETESPLYVIHFLPRTLFSDMTQEREAGCFHGRFYPSSRNHFS